MGIAEADLNADGFPDYALTSMGDTKMQILDDEADEESPIYRDIAFERGATAHRPYTGMISNRLPDGMRNLMTSIMMHALISLLPKAMSRACRILPLLIRITFCSA